MTNTYRFERYAFLCIQDMAPFIKQSQFVTRFCYCVHKVKTRTDIGWIFFKQSIHLHSIVIGVYNAILMRLSSYFRVSMGKQTKLGHERGTVLRKEPYGFVKMISKSIFFMTLVIHEKLIAKSIYPYNN